MDSREWIDRVGYCPEQEFRPPKPPRPGISCVGNHLRRTKYGELSYAAARTPNRAGRRVYIGQCHRRGGRPSPQGAVVDIDNGARLTTYVIEGPRNSGVIGINGAAARLINPGDLVILIAYAMVEESQARDLKPHVVYVDADNKLVSQGHDAAEVPDGHGLVSGAMPRDVGCSADDSSRCEATARIYDSQ